MPALVAIQSTEERIARIENGLVPESPLRCQPPRTVILAERMKTLATPGVSVAVIENGKIAWAKGWGVREAGQPDPITSDTLFQAASISKPVTALAVLRLAEHGYLDLDEDVNAYLTSWKVPANGGWQPRVTLRQLLSHTGGTTVPGFPGYPQGQPLPAALQVLNGKPPANTDPVIVNVLPGTLNRYSGGGTTIVQQLLVDLLGQPFPQIIQELVLNPLGMDRSTYELPRDRWQAAATAHPSGGTPQPGRWHVYPEMAAAGLWTTPSDLARFAIALQGAKTRQPNSILSGDMIDQMMTSQLDDGAGLGVMVSGTENARRFGHGGWNLGFVSNLVAYQEKGFGCVVMLNSNEGVALLQEITRAVAREYGWPDFLPAELEEKEQEDAVLDAFVGEYSLAPVGTLLLARNEGRLMLRFGPQPAVPLRSETETKFFAEVLDAEVMFVKDEDGQVSGLTLRQGGKEIKGYPLRRKRGEG